MNKLFLVSAVISLCAGFSGNASAAVKIHPPCQEGYRQDSVGRGIEAAFTGQDLLPNPGDQSCYNFGMADEAVLDKDDQLCQTKFAQGRAQGLIEAGNSSTDHCFSFGYIAGLADLHVGMRAGDATVSPQGDVCLSAYQSGWANSQNQAGQNSGNDHFRSDCYLTGYYDQEQLK